MKSDTCEQMQALMSGYLDHELDAENTAKLDAHLAQCETCRDEFDQLSDLVAASATLSIALPPDEVWDGFLNNVYNRLERRTGWTIFTAGVLLLTCFGAYHFITDPWASAMQKTLIATPVIGLGVLFVSVLRQRLLVAKTDRYTRDIKR